MKRRGAGSVGVSDQIDAVFSACGAPGRPGIALGVIDRGEVVCRRAYGLADVEVEEPLTTASLLHLGSTTKHFCAASLLILEDRGRLSLEDPVGQHLPELAGFVGAISLRRLLNMTSGLPDALNYAFFAGLPPDGLTPQAHLEIVRRLPEPMFAPGEGTTYSNTNYFLASLVVERLGGEPLADFMRRELFEPLSMTSTRLLAEPASDLANQALGYTIDPQGAAIVQPPMNHLCGDGGIVTNLEDLLLWAGAYATGAIPVRDLRARLETEGRLGDGSPTGYGLGMGLSTSLGLKKVSHGGGMPGFLADFAYWPKADLAVVWLSNWMDPALFERTDEVAALALGGRPGTPKAPASIDSDLACLEGLYANYSLGCTAQFDRTEDGAVLHVMGERLSLRRTAKRSWRPTKTSAYFPFRLTDRTEGGRPILQMRLSERRWSELRPIPDAPFASDDLERYAGVYRCDPLDLTHRIELNEGGLEVALDPPDRQLMWRQLKARGNDLFSAVIPGEPSDTDVSLIFRRDAAGQVAGFAYNLARTRGVAFRRCDDRR